MSGVGELPAHLGRYHDAISSGSSSLPKCSFKAERITSTAATTTWSTLVQDMSAWQSRKAYTVQEHAQDISMLASALISSDDSRVAQILC